MNKITITKKIEQTIIASEGKNYISMTFDSNFKCIGYDSNLHYKKSVEDWKLNIRLIKKILESVKSL